MPNKRSDRPSHIPGPLSELVRRTSVPPYLRALFSSLPRPVAVVATVPHDGHVPAGARQILRLGLVSSGIRIDAVHEGALELVASMGDKTIALGSQELSATVDDLARRILLALLDGHDLTGALETFASQSAQMDALQRLTRSMLERTDLDRALYVMLTGITSGVALGFNRAALFLFDAERRMFTGSKAIGPADMDEAHRIWEAIEYDDKTIEDLVDDYSTLDTRFQQFVQTLELAPRDGDEVSRAMTAAEPVLFTGAPTNEGLVRLGAGGQYILSVLAPRGVTMGLIACDNVYSKTPIAEGAVRSLGFFLDQMALVWENLSLLARVEVLAHRDPLTGLFNRRAFDARFAEEQSRASRAHTILSFLVVDVDHFKRLNDTRGHQAGDEALRTLGAVLKAALRTHDVVGRFGGDEFAVLLPETARDQMAAVATRIGALAMARGISLSIGGASWPDDCEEPSGLLARADANLYEAKRAGRACAAIGRGEIVRYTASSSSSHG